MFLVSDGEYLFVDLENKLSKYAPKNWRSSHTYVSILFKIILFTFCIILSFIFWFQVKSCLPESRHLRQSVCVLKKLAKSFVKSLFELAFTCSGVLRLEQPSGFASSPAICCATCNISGSVLHHAPAANDGPPITNEYSSDKMGYRITFISATNISREKEKKQKWDSFELSQLI